MMADCGLALAELRTQGADVPLALGQDQDHLEPGRVADMLEQDRRTARLMIPLLGARTPLGLVAATLEAATLLMLVFAAGMMTALLNLVQLVARWRSSAPRLHPRGSQEPNGPTGDVLLSRTNPSSTHDMAVATQEPDPKPSLRTGPPYLPERSNGLALSQDSTSTNGHVDRSTRDWSHSHNDSITLLRERISTWVVDDILELFSQLSTVICNHFAL